MLSQLLLFNWSTSTVTSQLHQDNQVRQSVLLTKPESVGTCRAFFLSLGMRTVIKGVLFSSSPVRGAIELGCTTRQQNTGKFRSKQGHMPGQYEIKPCAKALRKKKKQGSGQNLLDHLLINREAGRNKICLY